MKLCMLLPSVPDRRWVLARQTGVRYAIAKLAPELTGRLPPWDEDSLRRSLDIYREGGFEVIGLEGDQFDMSRIKQGHPGADEDYARYRQMLEAMGRAGIGLLCLNFMVGLGWYRTATTVQGRGGARLSAFDSMVADAQGPTALGTVPPEAVWAAFTKFMKAVAPAAEAAGVQMGLHPDDPPVQNLRGIARILTSADALERALEVANSPAVRLTFCQGTLRTMDEDVSACVRRFASHIAFIHVRDVHGTRDSFVEAFPEEGDTDMAAVFRAYADAGLDVPIRPDHAPALDGDTAHTGAVEGTNVGYEGVGMTYAVAHMKGLMQGCALRWT